MNEEAFAAAQRQLDACNRRDIDAFMAAYAPDCVVRAHPSGRILLDGGGEMRKRYARQFEEHPDLHCELLHRITHGLFVIDHERVTGLRGDEVVHAVAMYEVRDGAIVNVWFLRED